MKLFHRESQERQDQVHKTLDDHEQRLNEYARRVRRLEIEAGIYNPPMRKVQP